jgi:hypothetical protein
MVSDQKSTKTLCLHIGLGKTGTSALQSFFAQSVDQLSSHGIWYPSTGREGLEAHHQIATAARPGGGTGFDTSISWPLYMDLLRDELAHRPEPTVLMSSEVFSGRMTWKFLRDLKKLFAEIRIIAYLRRQDTLIASNYNQWVKTENLRLRLEDLRILPFDFEVMLEPWNKLLVGHTGGLVVCPYERDRLRNGSIVDDFMHSVFDLDIDCSFGRPIGQGSNPRLSLSALEYKRRVNVMCPRSIAAAFVEPLVEYSAHELLARPETEAAIFSAQQRREILAAFAESNASVARRYLGVEDGILFVDDLVESDEGDAVARTRLDFRKALVISRHVAAWYLAHSEPDVRKPANEEALRQLIRGISWPCSALAPFLPDQAIGLLIRRLAVAFHGSFVAPTDEDIVGLRWAKS